MKKILSLALCLALMLGMFAMLPAKAEEIELNFWTWRTEDVEFYNSAIAEFEAANPGIKVKQEAIKNTEYNTVLSAALNAGEGAPDVFMSRAYGGLQTYSDSGYIQELDELIPTIHDYAPTALQGATSLTDGKIYGVPVASQTVFCYYNKKLYKELGLEVPTTWNQFIENLKKSKEAGYIGLANGTKDGWTNETLFGGVAPSFYGGDEFFNKLMAGETNFEDPAFVAAIEKMYELREYMPDLYEGVNYEDMRNNFVEELAVHFIGGSYEAGYLNSQNDKLEYGMFAVPGEEGKPAYVSVYADANFSIAKASKHPEEALTFLKYLASKEFGEKYAKELKMVSSTPGIDVSDEPFIQEVLKLQEHSANFLFLVGFRYEQPTGSSLLQSTAQEMMVGKMTPADMCAEIQKGIAAYFKPFQK